MGEANSLLSSPTPPVWGLGGPLPPASPDLPGLPPMPPGPIGGVSLGGQGTGLGAQQAPGARVGGAIALCSSPAPPTVPLPPASPDLPGLPPMPTRTHETWRGLWRAGDRPGSSASSPGPSEQGNRSLLLSHSSWMAPPPCHS